MRTRKRKEKTLADYEKARERRNERQREYRRENKELCEVWTQRTYANYLRARGWTVTPPPGFPTLEEVREKRDLMRSLPYDVIDWSDPSAYSFPPQPHPVSKGPIPDELKISDEEMPF